MADDEKKIVLSLRGRHQSGTYRGVHLTDEAILKGLTDCFASIWDSQ